MCPKRDRAAVRICPEQGLDGARRPLAETEAGEERIRRNGRVVSEDGLEEHVGEDEPLFGEERSALVEESLVAEPERGVHVPQVGVPEFVVEADGAGLGRCRSRF